MEFYIVDCFAEQKYQGNQLAVFFPDAPLAKEEMQAIAQEMHFSETTFVCSGDRGNNSYDVRIFTPDVEVPFAGHPVLGTAHMLREINRIEDSDTVYLNLEAGKIPVQCEGERLFMTQNQPTFGMKVDPIDAALALSLQMEDIAEGLPLQLVSTGLEAIIVPLSSLDVLHRCRVNFDHLRKLHETYCKCNVLAFVPSQDSVRVRVFLDDTGFLEDPATGSANGCLAAYLLAHDVFNSQSIEYRVMQGIEMNRPSTLYVEASRLHSDYSIRIGGTARTVASGVWR